MIKDIKVNELLNSEQFVREPVIDVCKKIENSSSKKNNINRW